MERTRPTEVRLSGRTLAGVALRYGEPARDRAEMFEPGAFAPLGPVALNLQHDPLREIASTEAGTLRIDDGPTELRLEADLRDGSAELSLVRRGALRGLSVEFVAMTERRDSAGLRVIRRARLPGVGLVDSGSYRTQLELRNMADAWLRARVPYGRRLQCECSGPDCDSVEFAPGSLSDLGSGPGDVLAVGGGGFANVLGSLRRGSLLVEEAADGLRIGLTESGTETARRIVEGAAVAPFYARPLIDLEESEFVELGRVRTFTRAVVRALLVKPTPNDRGHIPAKIAGVEDRRFVEPSRRRRRWL